MNHWLQAGDRFARHAWTLRCLHFGTRTSKRARFSSKPRTISIDALVRNRHRVKRRFRREAWVQNLVDSVMIRSAMTLWAIRQMTKVMVSFEKVT